MTKTKKYATKAIHTLNNILNRYLAIMSHNLKSYPRLKKCHISMKDKWNSKINRSLRQWKSRENGKKARIKLRMITRNINFKMLMLMLMLMKMKAKY